jgi:flagellar L-ring protein precursor FlgH
MRFRTGFNKRSLIGWLTVLTLLLLPAGAAAKRKNKPPKPGAVQTSLDQYLARVRGSATEPATTLGSLWNAQARLADPSADYKARNAGDLVIVRVVESLQAKTDGSVQSERSFEAQSGISGLFGQLGATSGLRTMFSPTSSNKLDGKAQSSRNSLLQTRLSGQVVEVLPNGILVIQAAREVNVGNERQTIIVRGLVRPGDVSPDNTVLSTAIGNLEVEVKGKGVVSDGTRPPLWIVRMLTKILGF